jgi:hypothetical protein
MGRHRCTDTLPDNPDWIEIKRSDGCSEHWPKTGDRMIDHPGYIDSFDVVPLDEPGRSIKWRNELGMGLAESMNLPGTIILITCHLKQTNHSSSSQFFVYHKRLA